MPLEQRITRKLRAILSADVKGYSILMADDEVFTIKTSISENGMGQEGDEITQIRNSQ